MEKWCLIIFVVTNRKYFYILNEYSMAENEMVIILDASMISVCMHVIILCTHSWVAFCV